MKQHSPPNPGGLSAAIIVGHGSILSDAGAAMMRIADSLRREQITPIVQAGFLNYNQPTFADALAAALEQGATTILIVPYFLIAGAYVSGDLLAMVDRARQQHPEIHFKVTEVLGTHSLLADLAEQRLQQMWAEATDAANQAQTAAQIAAQNGTQNQQRSLLFVAHGTPLEAANLPILQVMQAVQRRLGYADARVGYLDCNQPDIPAAFEALAATADGQSRTAQIDVLPYFLHLGRHVRHDLPAHFAAARQRYVNVEIRIARHLDDEAMLARICAERIRESLG